MPKQPILLIGFNKPHTTQHVFETIRQYQPSRLYFAVDGPRHEADEVKCREVRAFANLVDWECEVKTLFREKNVGCNVGVSTAISWFFEHETEGIILEDDCVADPSFFVFCEKLLDRYRHDTRISIISGSNHLLGKYTFDSDYYYSNMHHIWGWATWKRSWEGYTLEIKHYDEFVKADLFRRIFRDKIISDILLNIIKTARLSPTCRTTWDYRFFYFNLLNHRLSIIPSKNLVKNIGFDGTGHSGGSGDFVYSGMKAESIPTSNLSNLKAPATMIPFYEGELFTLTHEFKLTSSFQRFKKTFEFLLSHPVVTMIKKTLKALRSFK